MAAHMDSIKLIVVGDSGVGKTTFLNGIINQTPLTYASSTIGGNVEVFPYDYNGSSGHQREVFLEFWDIGGSSGHRNSRSIFYAALNGIILVHDLSNRKSFLNLKQWLNEVLNSGKQELTGVSIRNDKDINSEFNKDIYSKSTTVASVPVLILGTKEDQATRDVSSHRNSRMIGLNDESQVFYCDMNCLQQSQLLTNSTKWTQLNSFFDKVIENRFYPSGKVVQESEYWRGRKKMF